MATTTSEPSSAANEEHSNAPPSRRVQAVELGVFLLLIVPSMVLSLFVIRQGNLSFPLVAATVIFRDLALVGLVLYFLWRNGEPLAAIGWRRGHLWREIGWGLVLFVPFAFGTGLVEEFFAPSGCGRPPSGRLF